MHVLCLRYFFSCHAIITADFVPYFVHKYGRDNWLPSKLLLSSDNKSCRSSSGHLQIPGLCVHNEIKILGLPSLQQVLAARSLYDSNLVTKWQYTVRNIMIALVAIMTKNWRALFSLYHLEVHHLFSSKWPFLAGWSIQFGYWLVFMPKMRDTNTTAQKGSPKIHFLAHLMLILWTKTLILWTT